jgi:chaperonin GroEL
MKISDSLLNKNHQLVTFGDKAQQEMLKGAEILYNAVKSTMGPSGHNVAIDNGINPPFITKDGVTVAKNINLKDKLPAIGAELIKEVAGKTNENGGDGTTTATVLAYNLFYNGYKMAATGRNTIALKRGIDWACGRVLGLLKESSIPVRNDEDIISVGTISANGDREIGKLLCEAIKKVGEDGIVTVEKAKSVHTTLDIIEGLSLDTGYTSPYFVTNQEKLTAELENPLVLVTNKKLTSKEHVLPVLQIAHEQERSLLIIADEIDQEALHVLLTNKMHGTVISCAVKAPSYGENRTDILQDICLVTGATCFDASQSTSIEKLTEGHLGTCEKIIVSKHQTTIVGLGDPEFKTLIAEKIEELKSLLNNPTVSLDDLKRNNTKKRLAKLSGGIAVVNVGGSTEVEIIEKKDRVDDALNATQAAVQEGILPGGGTALFYCAEKLSQLIATNPDNLSEDELFGAKIVYETCKAPLRVIVENTGRSYEVVSNKLLETSNNNFRWGYDAYNHKYCDLIDAGIIDPLKVERFALSHACSVVGLLLTTNCVITTQEEENQE